MPHAPPRPARADSLQPDAQHLPSVSKGTNEAADPVTTTVTEQEKREVLARWEGWTGVETINGNRVMDLPDYWNDGNAMLRLGERLIEDGYHLEIARGDDAWCANIYEGMGLEPIIHWEREKAPAAVAEAVYEAIQ